MANNNIFIDKARSALKFLSEDKSKRKLLEPPDEILHGEHLNYDRWTLLLTDQNLKKVALQSKKEKFYLLDTSKSNIQDLFNQFWTPKISSNGIVSISLVGSKLVTDYGIVVIARNSPNLKSLNISKCINITDASIREIGLHCSDLEYINMSNCYKINGNCLVAIGQLCKKLKYFNISSCNDIESSCLLKLFSGCNEIEEVIMSNLNNIGDNEIVYLSKNCPNLRILDCKDSPYISDEALLEVATRSVELEHLDISRKAFSFRVKDASLLSIGKSLQTIQILRLSGCDYLTDVGLSWLCEGCKLLEELDISNCPRVFITYNIL